VVDGVVIGSERARNDTSSLQRTCWPPWHTKGWVSWLPHLSLIKFNAGMRVRLPVERKHLTHRRVGALVSGRGTAIPYCLRPILLATRPTLAKSSVHPYSAAAWFFGSSGRSLSAAIATTVTLELEPSHLLGFGAASWNSWAPTRSLISNTAVDTLYRGNGGDRSKATAQALMNQSRSRLPYIGRRAYRWTRRGSLTQEQNDAVMSPAAPVEREQAHGEIQSQRSVSICASDEAPRWRDARDAWNGIGPGWPRRRR
jgi:hypothetical protein